MLRDLGMLASGVEAGLYVLLYVLLKTSEQLVVRWIEYVCCHKGHWNRTCSQSAAFLCLRVARVLAVESHTESRLQT